MRPLYCNFSQKWGVLISIIILLFLIIGLSSAEQSGPFSLVSSSSSEEVKEIESPVGSPERFISIKKEIYSKNEYYLPSKSLKISTIIEFIKYKNDSWTPEGIEAYEIIDENLELNKDLIKCELYDNPFSKSDIRFTHDIKDNGFYIYIPEKILSNQTIVYEYNVTVEKTGLFTAKTLVMPGRDVHVVTERTLNIRVSDFDFFSKYKDTIKEIVWILVILSGIFTAYRGIAERPTRRYHLKDMFSDIIKEYIYILKSLSYKYILGIATVIIITKIYSYISLRNPKSYPTIGLIIANNLSAISEFGPFAVVLVFIIFLLYINIEFRKFLIKKYNNLINFKENISEEIYISIELVLNSPKIIWIKLCNMSPNWSKFIFMVVVPAAPLGLLLVDYICKVLLMLY